MILAYFNERGFRIEDLLGGEVVRTYDAPAGIECDATALYDFRWYVLNNLLEQLREWGIDSQEELLLYTDSRLVEELNGELKTDSKFASDSRLYYICHDLPRFRRIRIEKCSPTTIKRKLGEKL